MTLAPALFAAVVYCALCAQVTPLTKGVWVGLTNCALVVTNFYAPSPLCPLTAFALMFA
jgi:hypothetical protein